MYIVRMYVGTQLSMLGSHAMNMMTDESLETYVYVSMYVCIAISKQANS